MQVRPAAPRDLDAIVPLRVRLWPDEPADEHRDDAAALLEGRARRTMPTVIFVAEDAGRVVGFVEVGLRSYADGCDAARPCGFVEGWIVEPEQRRRGIGRALIARAEQWAREQGCVEIASDTWIDSEESQRAHAALGFEVVDRCVNYRKTLPELLDKPEGPYGAELAHLHHDHFGAIARSAARELVARLSLAGISSGLVVDLAAGSGILARRVAEAGFTAWGVELSEEMLRIARVEAPDATFVAGSLWKVELPRCVAVTAIGEALSYATDPAAGLDALEERLAAIHAALEPDGLLLFDVAAPGRTGPAGTRRAFWTFERAHLGLEEEEQEGRLTRRITLFLQEGHRHRRVQETHVLRLYGREDIEPRLARAGFRTERLTRYGDHELGPGWDAYLARK